jgi:hypothetical protein
MNETNYLMFTTKISVGTLSIVTTTVMVLFQCLIYPTEINWCEIELKQIL